MIIATVKYPDGFTEQVSVPENSTPQQLAERHPEHCPYVVLACSVDHFNRRITIPLRHDCTVELLDMRSPYGNQCYQNSLALLYLEAVHHVFGKNVKVTIANSLSQGLFTRIHIGTITDEQIKKVSEHMQKMVKLDLTIGETRISKDEMLNYLKNNKDSEEYRLVKTAKDLHYCELVQLDDETGFSYCHLVPSTRYLKLFDVRRYRTGVLLRFPNYRKPDTVPPYEEQKQLYEAFSEETQWEQLMNVRFVADLNQKVLADDYRELIMLSEALHEKKIAEIAGMIHESRRRIILIAGPSSSGKTSFAKRLCIQLRVLGLKPLYLGTDDYFLDRAEMIPDENGNLDFESLSAVDVKLFTQQMNDLLAGRKVDIPSFDFITGTKVFGSRLTSLEPGQPIVIEGIHGLNPAMTEGIDNEEKFKIYISPLTQLNIDMHHRVPTTDARMLRRMVRDNRTRGRSAAVTIRDWPAVRAGEEVNIFPYNKEADVFFNSQCLYELAVLKKYAKPLLEEIPEGTEEYGEARRMLRFLRFFEEITDDSVVANNSIIREFIGGSILVS